MITAKRLLEAFWALTGVFFAKMFPLVGGILLIRIFEPDAYGRYSLTIATINLLLTATGAGLVGGLVTRISAERKLESTEACRRHIRSFVTVNFSLLAVVLCGSAAAATFGLLDERLAEVVYANWAPMLILLVTQVQLASQSAVATVAGILKRLAFTSLIGGFFATVLQLGGGLGWSVSGALWGIALGYLVQLLLQARYLRSASYTRQEKVANSPAKEGSLTSHAWSDFIHYGGYMFGSSVLVSVGMWLLSYSLLHNGTGMRDVAAFGVLNHWRMLLLFVPLALSNYLTSRFALQNKPSERIRILTKSLGAAATTLALLTGATFLLAPQILSIYGRAYADLKLELYLIALVALMSGLNSIFGNFLTGSNLFREGLISNFVWFVGLVSALAFLRTDGFDVWDASVCLLFAYVLHTFYQVTILFRSRSTSGSLPSLEN